MTTLPAGTSRDDPNVKDLLNSYMVDAATDDGSIVNLGKMPQKEQQSTEVSKGATPFEGQQRFNNTPFSQVAMSDV